nr:N-acetylmuramic acid 6-phosphate etherase [Fusobacterium gastrosuis]
MIDLSKMTTEKRNPNSSNLSSLSIKEAIELMNNEDYKVVDCVKEQINNIENVIRICTEALQKKGRIIYIGAGTSGRLGLLDAVECPPTFGVDYNTVVGIIAGGERAFIKAVEGAEDSKEQAMEDLKNINFSKDDVLVGIAASGRTPYVIGAINYAKEISAKVCAIVCNKNSEISKICKNIIEVEVGPEILTGSTRLKAGTATKMVLNMISTISMVNIGKVYKNYMVDVKTSNQKLVVRAKNIVKEVTGCTEEEANVALEKSEGSAKVAIVMILLNCDVKEAKENLEKANGRIQDLKGSEYYD